MRPMRTVLLGLLSLLVLAGCGSHPAQVTAPGGADGDAGTIAIRDARFTANPPRTGDEAYAAGADAPLTLTIVNTGDGPDRLATVFARFADGVDVRGDGQIPGGSTLVSHDTGATVLDRAVPGDITLTGLREPLRAGLTYPVTFTFERAGPITLQLPIDNRDALPSRAEQPG